MATPPLPQTSPQGGPNPNNTPPGYVGLSVLDLPSFGGSVDAALTGGARAAAQANLRQQQQQALAPTPAPAQNTGLPAYSPNDPSLVATPANGVMGQGTGFTNWLAAKGAQDDFDSRLVGLTSQTPGIPEAIGNWLFNKAGGAADQLYQGKVYAGQTYERPEAQSYFAAHPSLLAAAEKDPVGFATKLGPILDAAVKAQSGAATRGAVTIQTPDGTMTKPDDNVDHTNAVAAAFGMTPNKAHPLLQPHHYTPEEWLHATEGVTNRQLQQMWEMQHYLNPQQQALATALSIGSSQAQAERAGKTVAMTPAEQRYYDMLKIGGGLATSLPPAGQQQQGQ